MTHLLGKFDNISPLGAEEGAAWFEQIAQIKVTLESLLLPRLRRRLLRPLNP